MSNFYDFKLDSLQGKPDVLGNLKGKVTLAVNVASKCGLTPQYSALEDMQEKLGPRGFSVVGFPCNQFGGQEPGTAEQIEEFCSATYGVTFPMTQKIEVNGPSQHALYKWLKAEPHGKEAVGAGLKPGMPASNDISWNFEKFLIGKDGHVIKRYSPRTPPDDPALQADIQRALQ
jgi:glutathione peroxidase